ncbi:MAG: hypothetical protein ACOYN0_20325 [Phycisphaerales bacterium]
MVQYKWISAHSPVSYDAILARFADERSASISAGRLRCGETVRIPSGFPQTQVTDVSIRGDIFRLGTASHSALVFG